MKRRQFIGRCEKCGCRVSVSPKNAKKFQDKHHIECPWCFNAWLWIKLGGSAIPLAKEPSELTVAEDLLEACVRLRALVSASEPSDDSDADIKRLIESETAFADRAIARARTIMLERGKK